MMINCQDSYDALIIGGGFYGAVIANHLVEELGLKRVILIDKEDNLMLRASSNNQARVHLGTHYPRDLKTAISSRSNQPKFLEKFASSVYSDFTHLYALARHSSKVRGTQFVRFCESAEIELKAVDQSQWALFDRNRVEEVFVVQEPVFNSDELSKLIAMQINKNHIEVLLGTTAGQIHRSRDGDIITTCNDNQGSKIEISSRYVFNCTYSDIASFHGDLAGLKTNLKYELAEVALFVPPTELQDFGVTVMDGNFFSFLPFPRKQLYSLTHVKFTPRLSWGGELPQKAGFSNLDPSLGTRSDYDLMIRDAQKYVPSLKNAKYIESFYETKVLLVINEEDDGRPILFEEDSNVRNFYYVLGSKLDNVFDVLEKITCVVDKAI